jgi:hypothetical protein
MEESKDTIFTAVPALDPRAFTGELPPPQPEQDDPALELFRASILDQAIDYPPPVPLLNLINGDTHTPLITQGGLSLWHGKTKSKKTTLLAMMVAAFISDAHTGEPLRLQRAMDGAVIFFDTEQGKSYAARTMKLILKLAGIESSERLVYCDLRELSPRERLQAIGAGMRATPNIKLVVIDGLVDLLTDFMEAGEGHACITTLIRWASKYSIHIAGVLHQNKADKNARAHVGTIASQKCEIEISTEKDPNNSALSIVECVNSRGLPFEKFAIRWDKGRLPTIAQEWSEGFADDQKERRQQEKIKQYGAEVFKVGVALTHKEAVDRFCDLTLKGERTARRYVSALLARSFIHKGSDGLYRLSV